MAAAQHRPQKPNMFRRIFSPGGDHKGKQDTKQRSSTFSSASEVNGHRRDENLQGSLEVENTQYRDPEHLHQEFPVPNRTQSLVYPSSSDGNAPSLPPRNARPVSFSNHPLARKSSTSNDPDESPLYVEPANTLKRDASSFGNYTQVEPSEKATKQDIKQMTMYKQTMEQKQGGGHRRVRSIGHVIDKSEYSTPFDLLEENERAKQRGEEVLPASVRATLNQPHRALSDKPPPKPQRKIRQMEPSTDSDNCIPVVSPTPYQLSDRSHTNSPSSPHSSHSSEQEPIRDNGTHDYDDPWDQKFKDLPRMRASTKSDSHIGHIEARTPHRHTHPHHNPEIAHLNDRTSPPSPGPLERPRRPNRDREQVSLSPEVPNDRAFVKGGLGRNSGRREGSSSPLPPVRDGRSFSTPHPPHAQLSHHRFEHSEQQVVRTSSISMAGRLLPPTPSEVNERRILSRDPSPPPAIIDVSIPLEDQPWYHGSITRAQAESILADQPDFGFLVRKSESSNTNFSLSIRDYASGFIHLRMIFEAGPNPGYVLGQFSGNFNTVQECISFYTKQKLNIRGAEHKRLGQPIPRANNMAKYRM